MSSKNIKLRGFKRGSNFSRKNVSSMKMEVMGVFEWAIWEKEISEFPWEYQMTESCYITEGEAIVTPEGGEPVTIERGDYVIFPKG